MSVRVSQNAQLAKEEKERKKLEGNLELRTTLF